MNAADQIKHKILSDPTHKKHEINFVHLDGTIERKISTGILDDGKRVPGVLTWRDENGIVNLSMMNNFRHIYFDEVHRAMVEKVMEDYEKLEAEKLKESNGGR